MQCKPMFFKAQLYTLLFEFLKCVLLTLKKIKLIDFGNKILAQCHSQPLPILPLANAPWPHPHHGPQLTNTGEVEHGVRQGQGLISGIVGNLNLQREGPRVMLAEAKSPRPKGQALEYPARRGGDLCALNLSLPTQLFL